MTTLGVVGVGGIAVAAVRGLKAIHGDGLDVVLSPRNAGRAAALAAEFPGVAVAASNQEVLDRAEWILVSVLPGQVEAVLRDLRFHAGHKVLSLASTPKLADLDRWIGSDRALLCRINFLPFIEFHVGPVLVYPALPEVTALFAGTGSVIPTGSEEEFVLAQTLSCTLGPFYYLMDKLIAWMDSCGLPPERSAAYLEALLPALSLHAAKTDPRDIARLWKEQTPGGLNEMAMRMIDEDGGFAAWVKALDAVREKFVR